MQITKDGKYKTLAGIKARILTVGLMGIKSVAYVTDFTEGELIEYVTSGGKYALGETTQKDLVLDESPDFEIKVGPGYVCCGVPARVLAVDIKREQPVMVALLEPSGTEELIPMSAEGLGLYGEKLELAVDWKLVPVGTPVWAVDCSTRWMPEHFAGVHNGKTYVFPSHQSQHTCCFKELEFMVLQEHISLTER